VKRAYAFTRPVLNTYLTRKRDSRRRRELAWVLLAVLPVGFCGLAYVGLHREYVDVGYRILYLEKVLEERRQLEKRLSLDASYLAAPRRIEQRATDELGMTVAAVDQILFAEQLD
jgi:hypothetical protein